MATLVVVVFSVTTLVRPAIMTFVPYLVPLPIYSPHLKTIITIDKGVVPLALLTIYEFY